MRVAFVFILLFAAVLCRPARKVSSSDSSEEVVKRPALKKHALTAPKSPPKVAQRVLTPAKCKSTENTEEGVVVPPAAAQVKAAPLYDLVAPPDVPAEDSDESEDEDEDDTEESETEEEEDETTEESESESGESSPAPGTVAPTMVTDEPAVEPTEHAILPTIITDPDSGRGDSLGGYPADYKSIDYVEEKTYYKGPDPHKSYGYVESGKKSPYDPHYGNEVEKSTKVYKVQAYHVQPDLLDEDTSTPEVETQSLDLTSSTSVDQDVSLRQAVFTEGEQEAPAAAGEAEEAAVSESGSNPEEEQEEQEEGEESASSGSDSASPSEASEGEQSPSSEEAAASDSDSDEADSEESDSDEEGAGPIVVTDQPMVITAK